jgi:hypothetical protein
MGASNPPVPLSKPTLPFCLHLSNKIFADNYNMNTWVDIIKKDYLTLSV